MSGILLLNVCRPTGLAVESPEVDDVPVLSHASIAHAIHVDPIELHGLSGGRQPEELTGMAPRQGPAHCHLFGIDDEVVQLLPRVKSGPDPGHSVLQSVAT